jgi:hypothetical protein
MTNNSPNFMKQLLHLIALSVLFGGCYTQLKTADDKWGYGGTVTKRTETTTTTESDTSEPFTTKTTTETTTTVQGDGLFAGAAPSLTEESHLASGGTIINNYYNGNYGYSGYGGYYPSGWYWAPGFSFSIGFGFGGGYYDPYWGYPYYGYYAPYGYYPYYSHYPYYGYGYGYCGGWGYPPYIPVNYCGGYYGYNYPYVGYTYDGRPVKYGRIPGSERSTNRSHDVANGRATPLGGGTKKKPKTPVTNGGNANGSFGGGTAKPVDKNMTGDFARNTDRVMESGKTNGAFGSKTVDPVNKKTTKDLAINSDIGVVDAKPVQSSLTNTDATARKRLTPVSRSYKYETNGSSPNTLTAKPSSDNRTHKASSGSSSNTTSSATSSKPARSSSGGSHSAPAVSSGSSRPSAPAGHSAPPSGGGATGGGRAGRR